MDNSANAINYHNELVSLGYNLKYEGGENEVKLRCPFHEDQHASLGMNVKTGVYHCFACEAKGAFVQFLAHVTEASTQAAEAYLVKKYKISNEGNLAIAISKIEDYHKDIWDAKPLLDALYERAVTDETIRRYRIGYAKDGYGRGRICIPIANRAGEYVNVRYYLPGATERKVISMQKRNKPRFFPIDQLEYERIALVGGEVKALAALQALNQHDIGAISTCHSGEGKWDDTLTAQLKDKIVYIIMDVDVAGRNAASKIARLLYSTVKELYIVTLAFPSDKVADYPKGGVDDFIHVGGDVKHAIDNATLWQPPTVRRPDDEEQPLEVDFWEAFDPAHVAKKLQVHVTASAVGETPFFLPQEFEVLCGRDAGEPCALCPVFANRKQETFTLSLHPESSNYLRMIDAPVKVQHGALSAEAGIPHDCKKHTCRVTKHLRAEEVHISPLMDLQVIEEDTRSHQPALVINGHVEANSSYVVEGRMYPHPLTQRATFVLSKSNTTGDDLSNWTLESPNRLLALQPSEWTVEGLDRKLDEIYNYLSCAVTKVYSRKTLHLAIDIAYHSVLFLPLFGDVENGWVSSIILGDSAQGKSQAISRLAKFYNLGIRANGETATLAGLLGGFVPLGNTKRLFVQWGAFVKADRGLLMIEEAKGLRPDIISQLTEARSMGVVQLNKVETKTEKCRTRNIWISNARSDRPLSTYNFGVEALKELIGALEDLRRFDMCLCLEAVTDYDQRPREPQFTFDETIFRDAVLFAWTRSTEQVIFESDEYVLTKTKQLTEKYDDPSMPLLDKGSSRLKIARIAAALAARTYSIIDDDCLYVRNCHVDYAAKFLDAIYSHSACGFADYAKARRLHDNMGNEAEVDSAIRSMAHPKVLIEQLILNNFIEAQDIEDWTGCIPEQSRTFISILVRARALVRRSGSRRNAGYVKTTGFVEYLRRQDLSEFDKVPEYLKQPPPTF